MIETKEAKLNDEKIPEEAEVEISRVRAEKVTKEPSKTETEVKNKNGPKVLLQSARNVVTKQIIRSN